KVSVFFKKNLLLTLVSSSRIESNRIESNRSVYSIKCLQCNSLQNTNCLHGNLAASDCPTTKNHSFCTTYSRFLFLLRDCSIVDLGNSCRQLMYDPFNKSSERITFCYRTCQHDGCNTSSAMSTVTHARFHFFSLVFLSQATRSCVTFRDYRDSQLKDDVILDLLKNSFFRSGLFTFENMCGRHYNSPKYKNTELSRQINVNFGHLVTGFKRVIQIHNAVLIIMFNDVAIKTSSIEKTLYKSK
uniref:Protein sleepless n=1 Tax=Strigamia maritima TaxID=126957 RepID=T1IU21_STRMM